MIKPGDLIFRSGTGIISNLVKFFTKGNISHVATAYTNTLLIEADAFSGKTHFDVLSKYKSEELTVMRLKKMTDHQRDKLKELCRKYDNAPYSYWDCTASALFSWLPKRPRGAVLSILGNKRHMKCDELAQRLIWEACAYPPFKWFESRNPQSMFDECVKSKDFLDVNI